MKVILTYVVAMVLAIVLGRLGLWALVLLEALLLFAVGGVMRLIDLEHATAARMDADVADILKGRDRDR